MKKLVSIVLIGLFLMCGIAYAGKCWEVLKEYRESGYPANTNWSIKCNDGRETLIYHFDNKGTYQIGISILPQGHYDTFDQAAASFCECKN